MTNAEARFNNSLRPRKPEGSLGRTAQDVHLDSHTAPELCYSSRTVYVVIAAAVACGTEPKRHRAEHPGRAGNHDSIAYLGQGTPSSQVTVALLPLPYLQA